MGAATTCRPTAQIIHVGEEHLDSALRVCRGAWGELPPNGAVIDALCHLSVAHGDKVKHGALVSRLKDTAPHVLLAKASLRARAREPYYVYLEIIDSYNHGRRAESVIDPLPRLKYSRLRKTE